MKKRMSTVFFSVCFLAALIAEAYCIIILNGDMLSVIGIGIVVLIMGYLMLDSIRSQIRNSMQKIKFVFDTLYQEKSEEQKVRFTEMVNLQKATYTATKKSNAMLKEHLQDISLKVEGLEKSNEKAMHKIAELQKKSLEGQKNALNIEVKYNKENMRQLIEVIQEESKNTDKSEVLNAILSMIEQNNNVLQEKLSNAHYENQEVDEHTEIKKKIMDSNSGADQNIADDNMKMEDNNIESNDVAQSEIEEAEEMGITATEETEAPPVEPIYDDPNKSLSADEIASLFASFGQ